MLFNNKLDLVGLLLFFLLAVLPLVLGVGYALLYSTGIIGVLNHGFTLHYWKEVLQDPEIYYSLGFSFYVAATALLIAVILALAGTLLFHREIGRGFFSYIVYFPLAIPGIVAALFVMQIFSGAGFLSRICYQFGLINSVHNFPGLINDQWGMGIILALVMLSTPFFMIYFQTIYQSERLEELHQLATTLGASWHEIALKVKIPIILRRAFPTLVLYFIFMLGSYEIPLLLGAQSPQMVSVLVIRKLRRYNLMNIPQAYIIAILYIILVLSIVVYLFKKRKLQYDL
ncbi:MAG TPA: ABC transporter permease subunit [Balneolaceae bacterium]|nr:ABC transporter permease subunit [Balneolaceae bacterium]